MSWRSTPGPRFPTVGSNVVGGGGGVYDGGGDGGGGGVGVNAIENGNGDDHGGGGDGGGVGGENPADADAEMRRALSERASRTKAAKEAANAQATPQTRKQRTCGADLIKARCSQKKNSYERCGAVTASKRKRERKGER